MLDAARLPRPSRDTLLTLVVLLLLISGAVAAAVQQTNSAFAPPLASFSNAPDGSKALRLWLEQLDFDVASDDVALQYVVPDSSRVALILQPTAPFTEDALQTLEWWVADGGTAIVIGDSVATRTLMGRYDFSLRFLYPEATDNQAATPLLAGSLVVRGADPQPSAVIDGGERDDYVTLLAAENQPLFVAVEYEAGRFIFGSAPYPFTNAGIKQPGNAALVLNLIEAARTPGPIWFDEWHHGVQGNDEAILGLTAWLIRTLPGRAFLYTAVVVFIVLLWQGRRFGRPLTLTRERNRRSPLEYVTAIANLNRRAGNRQAIVADYRMRLKRHFGQRYHIDPRLDDVPFVERLRDTAPQVDHAALAGLLSRLNRPNPRESDLVKLAQEASRWLEK